MYRVITYKSKQLKKKTIKLAAEEPAADFDVQDLPEESGKKKKKRKKNKEESITYIIDGVEVREEDLTPDEKADIEAETLLNGDGFYTALTPIDVEPEEEVIPEAEEGEPEKKKAPAIAIAAVVVVTLLIIAAIGFVMVKHL